MANKKAVLFSEQEQQQHQLHVTHNAFSSQGEPPAEKRVRMSSTEVVQVKNQTEKIIDDQVGIAAAVCGEEEHFPVAASETYEDIITTINRIQKGNQEIFSRWTEDLSAAENFEELCPSRLDEILKEAYLLENSLIEQKHKLKDGLQTLSEKLSL